jgi:TolA-binding protein
MKKSLNPESEKTSWTDDVSIKDPVLSEKISNYMRACYDIEEVRNDPMFEKIDSEAKSLVSSQRMNAENSRFVREAFSEALAIAKIENEIKEIKSEASEKNINGLTAEWVKEWHRKKQMEVAPSEADKERAGFIKGSIDQAEEPSPSYTISEVTASRKRILRYIALPAAAVLGGFIILRTLTPSSDPQKIYSSYYQPFDAYSPVTRGISGQKDMLFSDAVKNYKAGNYEKAESGFSQVMAEDPASGTASFYLGLTEIASGNTDNAIRALSSATVQQCEFNNEAQWYLAMAYLKKGDGKNASVCLRKLSDKKGFYSDRSRKILRRLK